MPCAVALILLVGGCAEPSVSICGGGCPPGQICDFDNNKCIDPRPPDCPTDMGRFLSFAVDSENDVVFSTYTSHYGDLVVGRLLGDGSMSCEYVDGTPLDNGGVMSPTTPYILGDDVGMYSSMALDLFDRPHVAYFDRTHQKLKYARKSGESWTIVNVPHTQAEEDVVGRACSLDLDQEGLPHIAFWDETTGKLEVSRKLVDGRWALEQVPLDPERDDWPGTFGREVGRMVSLVLDSKDREWIAFQDVHKGSLKVAGRQFDEWTVLEVDPGQDVGSWLSAALDHEGNTAIAYYDRTAGALMYAFNQEGALKRIVVDNGATLAADSSQRNHLVGQHCSLAFGHDGLPRILYLDATTMDLKLARGNREGGFDTPVVVDAEGAVGFYSAFALGSDDFHVLSSRYERNNQGEMKAQMAHYQLDAGTNRLGGVP